MRSFKDYFILYLKGLGMGAADVVPGVSGGTIAFITGIYQQLLNSIKSFDLVALKLLFRFQIKKLFLHTNSKFILVLLAGIATSILSLSRVILYLLSNHPVLVWSFFFGLILASSILVGKKVRWMQNILHPVSLIIGGLLAFWITTTTPAETPTDLWFILLSGAIAICAMILPGISGSFILVLLVKYEYILGAVKDLNLAVIFTFGAGCVIGLLSFANLLSYLLTKHYYLTIALLTGFMVGSLNKVWPWKQVITTFTDRHGDIKPLIEKNILPTDYFLATGQEPYLFWAILLCVLGFGLVWFIEKYTVSIPEEQP